MGADYLIRTGPNQTEPVDSSTPEGRALIEATPPGDVISLTRQIAEPVEEQQDIERRREYIRQQNPVLQSYAATSMGALDELSFGLLSGLSSEEQRRNLQALSEENPYSNVLGSVAGNVLPALVTGGAGLGRGGVRALAQLTPGGISQAVGNTVTRRIAARLATRSALPSFAQEALSYTGGVVADGFVGAAADAVTQSNIQGTPLEAESLFTNGLFGAGLGLGVGGLYGLSRGSMRFMTGVGRRQLQTARQAGMAASELEEGYLARQGLTDVEVPERETLLAPRGRAGDVIAGVRGFAMDELGERALRQGRAAPERVFNQLGYAESARNFARSAQQLDEIAQQAVGQGSVGARRTRWARSLAEEGVSREASYATATALDDVVNGRNVDLMNRAIEAGKGGDIARSLRGDLADLAENITPQMAPGEVVSQIDDFLTRIEGDRLIQRIPDNAPDARILATEIRDYLRGSIRGDVWGSVGREFRQAHELNTTLNDTRDTFRKLTSRRGEGVDDQLFNDEAIAGAFSNDAFRVKNTNAAEVTERLIEDTRSAVNAGEELGTLSPEQAAAFRRQLDQIMEEGRDLTIRGKQVAAGRYLQDQEAKANGMLASVGFGAVGAATAGGFAAGPLGAAAGLGVGMLFSLATHPATAMARLTAVNRFLGKTERRIQTGLSSIRSSLTSGKRWRSIQRGGRQVPRIVSGLKSAESRQQEYNAITDQLRDYQAHPELLMDRIGSLTQPLNQVSPDLAAHSAMTFVRGVHYLADQLPAIENVGPFGDLERFGGRPSLTEINEFVRKYEIVEDPLLLLDLAANFQLTPDHVEAARSVYPELYAALQTEVSTIISELTEMPHFNARMQIGTLLDIPSDPTLDPEFIHTMQQQFAQTQEQQRQIQPRAQVSREIATNTYSESQSISLNL